MSAFFELAGKLLDAAKGLPALRREQRRKATLRGLLEDPRYQWRSLEKLSRAIGAPEQDTRDLLTSIGARGSTGDGVEVWGLKSRVDAPGARPTPPTVEG